MRKLIAQFTRFGVVGLVGLVIDLALFNVLRVTVFSPEHIAEGPLLAKLVSTSAAIVANWIGNRYWTFRAHRGRQLWREFAEFVLVSLGGMAIGLACLWVSHYLLGYTSVLADNISGNVIGLALGTLFRFTLYRLWVFAPHRGDRAPAVFPQAGTSDGDTGGTGTGGTGGTGGTSTGTGTGRADSGTAGSPVSGRPAPSSHPADATAPAGGAPRPY